MPVGEVLVVLDLDGGGAAPRTPPARRLLPPHAAPAAELRPAAGASSAGPVAIAVGDIREDLPGMAAARAPAPRPAATTSPTSRSRRRRRASSRASSVSICGASSRRGSAAASRAKTSSARAAGPRPRSGGASPGARCLRRRRAPKREAGDERVPIRGLRKRIFENMARSKHTAAHFNYVDECDVGRARSSCAIASSRTPRSAGVKLTFLPFIVKAVVAALKQHPRLNTVVDESAMELVLRKTYDIGIAASTDAGLIVPVVRDADRLSILDDRARDRAPRRAARDGKSKREDLGGSTFTITSLGKLGGLLAPPIINYPEVGIMGVHAIKQKPVVRGDQIVIGDVMHLSLLVRPPHHRRRRRRDLRAGDHQLPARARSAARRNELSSCRTAATAYIPLHGCFLRAPVDEIPSPGGSPHRRLQCSLCRE